MASWKLKANQSNHLQSHQVYVKTIDCFQNYNPDQFFMQMLKSSFLRINKISCVKLILWPQKSDLCLISAVKSAWNIVSNVHVTVKRNSRNLKKINLRAKLIHSLFWKILNAFFIFKNLLYVIRLHNFRKTSTAFIAVTVLVP